MQPRFEPDSLYIGTQALVGEAFHWCFIHTDATGTRSRHHWAQTSSSGRTESYVVNKQNEISNELYVAFFKVQGYVPMDRAKFEDVCRKAFAGQKVGTVEENRKRGLSCRTWVFRVMGLLREMTWLVRGDTDVDVEDKIKRVSGVKGNELATAFLRREKYIIPVLTV